MTGLAQGTYNLYANPWNTEYAMQKVKGINVVAGVTSEQNVSLHIGGKITGSVMDESGNLVWGGFVYAYTAFGSEGWGYANASTGTYTIKGLPSGTYVVQTDPPSSSKLAGKRVSGIAVQVENTTVVNFNCLWREQSGTVHARTPTGGYWYGAVAFKSPKTFSAGTLYADIMDVAYGGWLKSDGNYTISKMAPDSYDVYAYFQYYGFSASGVAPGSSGLGQSGEEPNLKKLLVQKMAPRAGKQGTAQQEAGGYE